MNSIIGKSQWIITAIGCFLFLAVSVTSTAVLSTDLYHNNKFRKPFKIGFENALRNLQKEVASSSSSSLSLVELKQDFSDLRGGGKSASSSSTKSVPGILKWAYSAVGIATTAVSWRLLSHFFLVNTVAVPCTCSGFSVSLCLPLSLSYPHMFMTYLFLHYFIPFIFFVVMSIGMDDYCVDNDTL